MNEPQAAAPPRPPFGLRWGIKRSFLDYIRRMPDGQGSLADGARAVGEDEILFAPAALQLGSDPDGTATRTWSFRGEVRFSGHFGMLALRLGSPALTVRGSTAELTIAGAPEDGEDGRLPLVTLDLVQQPAPDGIEIWHGTEVRLTAVATPLFNGTYPEGEPFEPLTVTLPVLARG